MKKILILLIGLVSLHAHAQTIEQMQKYMRFVPSNMKASDINPSDIPSEDILRQMGLSDEEISEAMNYKYQRGKYNPNFIDTTSTETSFIQSDLLYDSMRDSLFDLNDSIIYPSAKIYGQDFFRNNSISFFTRAYDNQAPNNYLLGEEVLVDAIPGTPSFSGGESITYTLSDSSTFTATRDTTKVVDKFIDLPLTFVPNSIESSATRTESDQSAESLVRIACWTSPGA